MGENVFLGLCVFLPFVSGGLLALFFRRLRRRSALARWHQILQGNALLLFFLAALIILAGELYFRFAYDSTDSTMYTKVSRRWFDRYYHLNGDYIRDNIEYDSRIGRGKRRVTFVGDSFTAGHGIKDVENRFVNRIRRAHPDWEVHMLAQLGIDTGGELGYLQNCLTNGYQPDQVVLVYCLNDIGDLVPEHNAALGRVLAEAINQSGWLRQNSYFFNTLDHRWRVRCDPLLHGYYDYVRDMYQDGPFWEQQKQRLLAFRDLVQSNGGRLAVVTFPFFHALGPHYDYRFVHQRLDAFWRDAAVPHLDLLAVYEHLRREQLTVSAFDAHPNEYAHAVATPLIEKLVSDQMLASSTNASQHQQGFAPHE